ncbi:uncharacterized protein LOC116352598 isoform X2 [Contarinia nasturtii]|uniref:uncharacterized protein LOC116352598 isoform X2 n=1 Tax=Contarinia nasturtii TaxID=265458 RepID=UPI0012D43FB4|nr:uncharacterized protein LOC116352598 isoform X2 [Contarinia nasturtii]
MNSNSSKKRKNDSNHVGWRRRQKQNEAHNRKMLANNMNEASMSSSSATASIASTSDSHANTVECQKTTITTTTHKESSPPNNFNNSSSLKYLHKKFKRVASAVIEENGIKSAHNAQLPNDEADLDISQSTSSDLELSNSSETASSDVISRSTTPMEESHSSSTVPHAALNFSSSSQGHSVAHSIASLAVPDRPYKPKFHKAVYYQNNNNSNNNNNNTNSNSISQIDDSRPKALIKTKPIEMVNENTMITHSPLSTQSVEYLKEHISKIISQNEAIMEGVAPALQKKYHKITGIPRGINSNVNNANETQTTQTWSESTSSSSSLPLLPLLQSPDEMLLKISVPHEAKSIGSIKTKPFPTLQQQAQQALKKSSPPNRTTSYSVLNLSSDAQPLNLTNSSRESQRKKSIGNDSIHSGSPVASTSSQSESNAAIQGGSSSSGGGGGTFYENHHPQNPERSIIKSLLLNSRGLAVPTAGEGDDAIYICPLCNISFRSADNLQYHTKCYCQGTPQVSLSLSAQANGSPQSAPISPVGSPSHKYFRSNSFNLYRPEKYSPSTLAKLASSSIRHHRTPLSLAKLAAQQAAGLSLGKIQTVATSVYPASASSSRSAMENFKSSASNRSTSPSSFGNFATEMQSVSSQCVQITKQLMDASLPSPGPLLGKTRLVDHYQSRTPNKSKETAGKSDNTAVSATEGAISLIDSNKTTPSKEPPSRPQASFSPSSSSSSSLQTTDELFASRNQKLLQMCGGEIKIVEKTVEKIARFGSSGGSIVSISSLSPDSIPENSPLSIRTGLLSGGSIIESPITVKRKTSTTTTTNVAISPGNIQQTILPLSSRLANNQNLISNYFQFPPPPINSITAYNPLTLPPKQPEFNSDLPAAIEATKIMHGGKIIPFVPGIPGPNSLSANAPLSPIIPSMITEKCSDRIFNPSQNPNSFYIGNMSTGTPSIRSINLSISSAVISPASVVVHTAKHSKSPEPLSKILNIKSHSSSEYHNNDTIANHPHNLGATQQQQHQQQQQSPHNVWPINTSRDSSHTISEKPFNFMRIADNLSPPKIRIDVGGGGKLHGNLEVSSTNLDKLKPRQKLLAQVVDVSPLHINVECASTAYEPLQSNIRNEMTPEKVKMPLNVLDHDKVVKQTNNFLRPSSLPLKPGTFTPKKHHGITPTANTLPLISPETPRPSKNCVQLYLNGHAYTYLGLKCSTKTFYCTLNRPQPVYALFVGRPELSMYSNWQTCAENNPHPLGFSPKEVMSLYDSRQRTHTNYQGCKFTTSNKLTMICAPSDKTQDSLKLIDTKEHCIRLSGETDNQLTTSNVTEQVSILDDTVANVSDVQKLSTVPGGYKSNEDYTYVRGRGRGRYVCIECGMRCIKPCTLKKHIRTVHSDVRPYTCRHCMFSFKTKGNLTKHMESKAHYKKCLEKGINPQTPADDGANPEEDQMNTSTDQHLPPTNEDCDTVSDDYSDGDELENEMENEIDSSDNEDAKLPDHEAAHCLLSLSQRSPCEESHVSPKSLVPSQPTTYPYVQSDLTTSPKHQTTNKQEFTANQHDGFIKSDSVISNVCVNLSSTETSATTSTKIPTEIKPKRVNMNADVIDLSKPRNTTISTELKESLESKSIATNTVTTVTATTTSTTTSTTPTSLHNAAELLKSLMTLSDKVPAMSSSPSYDLNLTPVSCNGQEPTLTNNMLLQTYLTERALQKSKMKLSQVHTLNAFDEKPSNKFFKESGSTFFMLSKKLDHIDISPKPRSMIMTNLDSKSIELRRQSVAERLPNDDQTMKDEKATIQSNEKSVVTNQSSCEKDDVKVELHITKPTDETVDLAKGINDQSGMDTLAEIAANSVKLDASKATTITTMTTTMTATTSSCEASVVVTMSNHDAINSVPTTSTKPPTQCESVSQKEISAKNIASEYLKLANEQDNAIDDSSASSDSDAVTDNGNKQMRRLSMMSLLSGPEVLMSARTVVVGEDGFKSKSANSSDLPMIAMPRGASTNSTTRANIAFIQEDGGPSKCTICGVSFPKSHQLVLHMNIHYMNPERKFKCNLCGVYFQTQNRLQRHMRDNKCQKLNVVETQGNSTKNNPRPFECSDCSRAFRIHGHLAKHLRSKTHVQRLENLQKLPFGTYQMIEEARINLTDIDTTDCDNSLASLKALAEKLKVESVSPDKRKAAATASDSYDSQSSNANNQDHLQSMTDNITDANTGSMIKKRKLNDDKDTLTINEGDEN